MEALQYWKRETSYPEVPRPLRSEIADRVTLDVDPDLSEIHRWLYQEFVDAE